jgi:hypothetical protein
MYVVVARGLLEHSSFTAAVVSLLSLFSFLVLLFFFFFFFPAASTEKRRTPVLLLEMSRSNNVAVSRF